MSAEPSATRGREPIDLLSDCLIGLLAAAAGLFAVWNTAIGWHLASGRWMLDNCRVLDEDLFSFTSQGAHWLNHEWLFQLLVAAIERAAGAPGLIAMRCLVSAALGLLALHLSRRAGLGPAAAMILATVAVYGARLRFFVRPELLTILLATIAVLIYLGVGAGRPRPRTGWTALLLGITVVACNLHGAALVIPLMLIGLWLAEAAEHALGRGSDLQTTLLRGAAVAAVAAAPMLNPHGWRLYLVPLSLTRLVGQAHVPNPEWISPSPTDLPSLWVMIGVGAAVLLLAERGLVRWALMLGISALALRYVRNAGLLFALAPLAIAPALARLLDGGSRHLPTLERLRGWSALASPSRRLAAACIVSTLIAAGFVSASPHPLGLGYSDRRYPIAACEAIERLDLVDERLYNDVVFGGYLIGRYFPEKQVFIDDRNEIHEPLLAQIFEIFGSSDVEAWQRLLDHHDVTTALVRYHEPIEVQAPDGSRLGHRGFSALWFPARRWALIYWDDTCMLFLRRPGNPVDDDPQTRRAQALVARHEYRLIRPDDLDHVTARLLAGELSRQQLASELKRKLDEEPDNRRALTLAETALSLP